MKLRVICMLCTYVFAESQEREKDSGSSLPPETDGMSEKHFETLSQMCRTHLR